MSALDLADIQGNIQRPYGRAGFPYARTFLFNIRDAAQGRQFVEDLRPHVTTAEPWESRQTAASPVPLRRKPFVALNISFTWDGLRALELPTGTLSLMPPEFIEGMACRNHILGDLGPSDPCHWDDVWQPRPLGDPVRVHAMVILNAQAGDDGEAHPDLARWTEWLQAFEHRLQDGVKLLGGHGPAGHPWQDSHAVMRINRQGRKIPTPKEHFGFTDGISDPYFQGQSDDPGDAIGGGKLLSGAYAEATSWQPLAAGEFLLGQVSEGQEDSAASEPARLVRNGTFVAVRKLHQNTASFAQSIRDQANRYAAVMGIESEVEARETLMAKMVGRWTSGIPLIVAPTWAAHQAELAKYPALSKQARKEDGEKVDLTPEEHQQIAAFERMLVSFRYDQDPKGQACPFGAHIRRANPRDMLDPDPDPKGAASYLTNRRRIIRRGLPYGEATDNDADEHGVFIMAICSSLSRQFEFVQQQWMQYGLDFEAGNDTCPIIGNRDQSSKFVATAPTPGKPPYIAADLPQFVETRGGDYFFIPSLTALRMIAMGTVDPT